MLKIELTFEDVYLINTTTTTFFSNSTFFRYFPKNSGKRMIIRSVASKLFLKHQNNCSLHFRKVALKIFRNGKIPEGKRKTVSFILTYSAKN